jgi:hypothetical protein
MEIVENRRRSNTNNKKKSTSSSQQQRLVNSPSNLSSGVEKRSSNNSGRNSSSSQQRRNTPKQESTRQQTPRSGPKNGQSEKSSSSKKQQPASSVSSRSAPRTVPTSTEPLPEFDFETANDRFKQEVVSSLKDSFDKLKIGQSTQHHKHQQMLSKSVQDINDALHLKASKQHLLSSNNNNNTSSLDTSMSLQQIANHSDMANEHQFYDKTVSFFDKISCEANEKSSQNKPKNWKEERKMNAETFGLPAPRVHIAVVSEKKETSSSRQQKVNPNLPNNLAGRLSFPTSQQRRKQIQSSSNYRRQQPQEVDMSYNSSRNTQRRH